MQEVGGGRDLSTLCHLQLLHDGLLFLEMLVLHEEVAKGPYGQ